MLLVVVFTFVVTGCGKENDDINIESKSHKITIIDSDGNPIKGIKINFTTSDKSENGVCVTDKDGCILHPVMYPNTKYTYTFSEVPDIYFIPEPVKVPANTNIEYCIVLKKAKYNVSFILSHNGEPVQDAQVTLMDCNDTVIETHLTDEDGNTSILISAGNYKYKISSASDDYSTNFSIDKDTTILIDR